MCTGCRRMTYLYTCVHLIVVRVNLWPETLLEFWISSFNWCVSWVTIKAWGTWRQSSVNCQISTLEKDWRLTSFSSSFYYRYVSKMWICGPYRTFLLWTYQHRPYRSHLSQKKKVGNEYEFTNKRKSKNCQLLRVTVSLYVTFYSPPISEYIRSSFRICTYKVTHIPQVRLVRCCVAVSLVEPDPFPNTITNSTQVKLEIWQSYFCWEFMWIDKLKGAAYSNSKSGSLGSYTGENCLRVSSGSLCCLLRRLCPHYIASMRDGSSDSE
jgi:hypothetical protein